MVSAAVRHKLNRDPIEDAFLMLLEFQEDGSATVIRAAANNEDVVSNGETYTAAAINVALPSSAENEVYVSLDMTNVHREPGIAIDAARNRIGVRMMLVDASDPDTLIFDTKNMMVMQQVSVNATRVQAQLGPRARMNEPFPFKPTTRQFFPALWFTR